MIDAFSKRVLTRRPSINYIAPRSVDTIPDPSPAEAPTEKPQRIEQLAKSFENLNTAALAVEAQIAERAKDVVLDLDLDNPEDFVTAQAVARVFPDCAEELIPGVQVCKQITFAQYNACMQDLKAHGKEVGQQNQVPATTPDSRINFGGLDQDRRPEMNKMSSILPPVPIPAYLLTTIPLLFQMLQPLRSMYVNSKIIGHTHNEFAVPGAPTGPGLPVNPL